VTLLTETFFDYLIMFSAGVGVSFTPCLYPVMPVTAGMIATVNTNGSRWMGFVFSLVYVLGLAVVYSALALVAVWTGRLFGFWQTNPFIFFFIAIFLFLLALMMLGVVSFPFARFSLQNRIKPKSFGAIFVCGMVAGLMVGPCTAPALGALLIYAASKQHVFHAISLLFVFSYGIGFSLILVGTFSGLLVKLPKGGRWLVWVQRVGAAILFVTALFFFLRGVSLFFNINLFIF
jgi:cytochrome c-type biogenesis protein